MTRHRLSGFHSFRTAVADEWLIRGEVEYAVRVDTLREPCAIAVGAITPAALVNCDFGWAPGSAGVRREHSWGYVMEEARADGEEAPPSTRAVSLGGSGTDGVKRVDALPDGRPLPSARRGDTFRVRLSPASGRVEITLRGASMVLSLPASDAGQPLALAVGLKYAADSVTLVSAAREEGLPVP